MTYLRERCLRYVPFGMMVLGLTMMWLLLVVTPVVIIASLLLPVPQRLMPDIIFVVTLAFALISGRSLWRRGIR